jgi:hypothetical protein
MSGRRWPCRSRSDVIDRDETGVAEASGIDRLLRLEPGR